MNSQLVNFLVAVIKVFNPVGYAVILYACMELHSWICFGFSEWTTVSGGLWDLMGILATVKAPFSLVVCLVS